MSCRELCWCGHDKATHYPDEHVMRDGKRTGAVLVGACLGVHCECRWYCHEDQPADHADSDARRAADRKAGRGKAPPPPPSSTDPFPFGLGAIGPYRKP